MAARKPDVPADLTDAQPAHMTDEELGAATKAAALDAGTLVTLAIGHPYDALVLHDEDGKPLTYTNSDGKDVPLSITSDGTEIPTSLEDQVRAAAKAEGVTIRKVR